MPRVLSWADSERAAALKKYLRVGDVARLLDVTIPTIHFWQTRFPMPVARLGGQRRFPPAAVNRLRLIKFLAYNQRMPLSDARKQYDRLISCRW